MKVTFQIEGATPVEIECNAGDNLLELARRANVAIDAPCSGNGSCGKCKVRLISGELLSPQTGHISDEEYADGWRLSCGSLILSDVTVLVPDIASAYQSRMKTADLSSGEEIAVFEKIENDIKEAGIAFTNDFITLDGDYWNMLFACGVRDVRYKLCADSQLFIREHNLILNPVKLH